MKGQIKYILAIVVLLTSIVSLYHGIIFSKEENHFIRKEFPSQIGNWSGRDIVYDKEVLSVLKTDQTIFRNYHKSGFPEVGLFIGYYHSLEKADFSHSPIVCFTGQGWIIEKSVATEIPVTLRDDSKLRVNHLVQNRNESKMLSYFWYQSRNHSFAERGIQKIYLFFDRIFGGKDNNAFVRIHIEFSPNKSFDEMTSYLNTFVQDMYPELEKYIREN